MEIILIFISSFAIKMIREKTKTMILQSAKMRLVNYTYLLIRNIISTVSAFQTKEKVLSEENYKNYQRKNLKLVPQSKFPLLSYQIIKKCGYEILLCGLFFIKIHKTILHLKNPSHAKMDLNRVSKSTQKPHSRQKVEYSIRQKLEEFLKY